jgi:hypothetical protein
MQKRTNLFIFVFICSLIWFRLFKESSSETSNLELLLVSLLYFICCMPLLLFLGTQKKNIPFVPIFTIFYFVNFGL